MWGCTTLHIHIKEFSFQALSSTGEVFLLLRLQFNYLAMYVRSLMLVPKLLVFRIQMEPIVAILVNPVCDPLITRLALFQRMDLFA